MGITYSSKCQGKVLLKKSNRKPFSEQQIVEEITNHFKSVVTREKVFKRLTENRGMLEKTQEIPCLKFSRHPEPFDFDKCDNTRIVQRMKHMVRATSMAAVAEN